MRICVIGASGNMGRALTEELVFNGYEVLAVGREFDQPIGGLQILTTNLREMDEKILNQCVDCDAIFYTAQSYNFRSFHTSGDDVLEINSVIPLRLLIRALERGRLKKFVYFSSGSVYSPSSLPLNESMEISLKLGPGNGYALSKQCGEGALLEFQGKVDLCIFRPFFIYGNSLKSDMLIPRLVSNIISKTPIKLSSDTGMRFNPVFVSDAAKAAVACLELSGTSIFNLAGPEVITIRGISELIGRHLQKKPNFEFVNSSTQDMVASIERLSSLFIPKTDCEAGLRSLLSSK
jgi:nucleoside-diphosphate-sugar epimerase